MAKIEPFKIVDYKTHKHKESIHTGRLHERYDDSLWNFAILGPDDKIWGRSHEKRNITSWLNKLNEAFRLGAIYHIRSNK